ncbi:MAG TPA: PAS domain S-box protein [Anaerolineales bacterium]
MMVLVNKLVFDKVGRLREKIGGPSGGALFSAALVCTILLTAGWQTNGWYQNRLIEERRAQLSAEAWLRANALSTAIHRRFALAEGLSAFVKAEHRSDNFGEMFELFAAGLYSSTPGIRNIALAPGGIMGLVFPLDGNESVIGYDPLQDSRAEIRRDVQRAMSTREIILSGPMDLIQGGKGLIARQAVYVDNTYWGLVNLVIDLPPILERAGFETESPGVDLNIALEDATGQLIYGSRAVFDNDPVVYAIQLPEGEWGLAILPAEGWTGSVLNELRIFQAGGLVIVFLLTSLTYLVVNRQARLGLAVRERTGEISRINEQLVADILERERVENALRASEERLLSLLAVAPDAIIAVDESQEIIVFNQAAELMFGYSSDEVLYTPLDLLLPERFSGLHGKHVANFIDEAVVTRRMDERRPIWGRRKDGSEFPAEASISKLVENEHVTLTVIVRDITRRKQMELELREREMLLEQRVAERTRELQRGADQFRAISQLGQRITSILNVDELLAQTAHLIQDAFGYYHVHIGLIQGDEIHFPGPAGVWQSEPDCSYCATLQLVPGPETICGWVVEAGRPLLVPDISQEPRYLHPIGATGSGVVVPLQVKGQVIGLLDVESREVNDFDESDVAVLQLLANQVAVAIENARLYEKAQYLAALQERQKLARELHDSVSQALYGLALGTRTARTLIDQDPQKAVEPLDYCLALAEAGLAEMRALIFELRPESLEKEGLVAALSKQSGAFRERHSIEVQTELCQEPDVPLNVKEALYRVTQEAMHNTIKHARASLVQLQMNCEEKRLDLWVCDNGIGFDTQAEYPGHLGIKSMRERVERVGGGIDIASLPGQGTKIHAWIPLM